VASAAEVVFERWVERAAPPFVALGGALRAVVVPRYRG